MTHLKLAIIGPGRMGGAVAELARAEDVDIVATLGAGTLITAASLAGADVAVEFTEPAVAAANIRACVLAGCPVVVGTTGWYDELPEVAQLVTRSGGGLLWASNFSLGANALSQLVRRAGELFSNLAGFEATLVETHHSGKKDAPSGTARMLQSDFATGSGRTVPITSVRVGSAPGTHELILDGAFEQLSIRHEARDRRVFAEGALVAAHWLVGRRGVFTLDDVLAAQELP